MLFLFLSSTLHSTQWLQKRIPVSRQMAWRPPAASGLEGRENALTQQLVKHHAEATLLWPVVPVRMRDENPAEQPLPYDSGPKSGTCV